MSRHGGDQQRAAREDRRSWSAERQSRRERLAIKVGERFMLVHSEDIVYASLADEASRS